MFNICSAKGFHLQFANGFALSVQWGPGNYCEKQRAYFRAPAVEADEMRGGSGSWASKDAEIAVFRPNGSFIHLLGDDVHGYVTTDQVAIIVAIVALFPDADSIAVAVRRVLQGDMPAPTLKLLE